MKKGNPVLGVIIGLLIIGFGLIFALPSRNDGGEVRCGETVMSRHDVCKVDGGATYGEYGFNEMRERQDDAHSWLAVFGVVVMVCGITVLALAVRTVVVGIRKK